MFKRKVVKM